MKTFYTSIRVTLLFAVLTGFIFPVIVWLAGQRAFPFQANGSLIRNSKGNLVGSVLISQPFTGAKYFHPRPSAAGNGYDPTSSGGTNLGPTSAKLFEGMKDDPATPDVDESFTGVNQLAANYRAENGLANNALIPVDAVSRSGSGLDPHISLANARLQAARIAKEREKPVASIINLINASTEPRFLGIFGEQRVNVLTLNIALDNS